MVIEANLTTSDEIGALVKLVNGFEIQAIHLNMEVPTIENYTMLQDQIMNYNARIYHDGMILFKVIPSFTTL